MENGESCSSFKMLFSWNEFMLFTYDIELLIILSVGFRLAIVCQKFLRPAQTSMQASLFSLFNRNFTARQMQTESKQKKIYEEVAFHVKLDFLLRRPTYVDREIYNEMIQWLSSPLSTIFSQFNTD